MKSTKKITRSVKASQVFRLKLAVIAIAACFSPLALANPVGPVVVNGAATIVNSGNTLTVTNTPGAILNWQQFNIGQGQTTQFIQQSAQSSVLNRVTGPDPSQIMGTMRSNGQVFLINPNGIMFGAGAVIDVNRLIASTLNITNADFLANNLKFNGNNGTSVINQGQITTPFGGSVYLIGNDVTNQGVITTPQGEVVLAAGNSVSLVNSVTPHISVTVSAGGQALNLGQVTAQGGSINIYGALVKQQGIVSADSASVDAQGNIMLSATQSVDLAQGSTTSATGATGGNITLDSGAIGSTTVAGAVEASGNLPSPASGGGAGGEGVGGTIKVLGNTIALTDTATLDASGTAGIGGNISLTGNAAVAIGGVVNASGTQGGAITVNAGSVSIAGEVSARGSSGQGGNIAIQSQTTNLDNAFTTLDVSGASGGTISEIAGHQITSSATYLATGIAGNGGHIDLSAPATKLLSAQIDASGTTGGGQIRVGGEYQGGKHLVVDELLNAETLAISAGSVIKADATQQGNGGTVILWSDLNSALYPSVSAKPAGGGLGGFIELSSGDKLTWGGTANAGVGGQVLMDPKNIVIQDATAGSVQYNLTLGYNYVNLPRMKGNSLEANDEFGASVSLSGTQLAVGASADDGFGNNTTNSGAVYLFNNPYTTPTLSGIIGKGYTGAGNYNVTTLGTGVFFGNAVSLSGTQLAVGAVDDNGFGNAATFSGAVYLFNNPFTTPTLSGIIGKGYTGAGSYDVTTVKAYDRFGASVSLSGTQLAVGAYADDGFGIASDNNYNSGAVYLFNNPFTTPTLSGIIGKDYTGAGNYNLPALDSYDGFGISVSLSGTQLAVGAFGDGGSGNIAANSGAVYLFNNPFTTPTLSGIVGKGYTGAGNHDLTALEANDRFGISVSLIGTQLAVGASGDAGSGNLVGADTGAVYLFNTPFATATLSGIIGKGYTGAGNYDMAALETGDLFGFAVSLSGAQLAVGARGDAGSGNVTANTGAVYLFNDPFATATLSGIIGKGYTGAGNLDPSNALEAGDWFGSSVSLSGTQLAVGAAADDGLSNVATNSGAVYLFNNPYTTPTLSGIIGKGYTGAGNYNLTALEAYDYFGISASLSDTQLAVGAYQDDGFGNVAAQSGAVYLFSNPFGTPTLSGIIGKGYTGAGNYDLAALEAGDQFGVSVSLSGTQLAVGANKEAGFGNVASWSGAVYLFNTPFTTPTLSGTIGKGYTGAGNYDLTALEANDYFGWSVSLSGTQLAVGAGGDAGFGNVAPSSGAVYLFSNPFGTPTLSGIIGKGYTGAGNYDLTTLEANDWFGGVSLSGTQLAIGANLDDGFGNSASNSGAVYLFNTPFTTPTLSAIIGKGYTSAGNYDLAALEANDMFGSAVSLSGTRLAVGAYADGGFGNVAPVSGAVYLFTLVPPGINDPATGQTFAANSALDSSITPASITAILDTGSTLILQANNDITVLNAIIANNLTGNGGALRMQAGRSILVNANITTDNGDLTLVANDTLANGVVTAERTAGAAQIAVASGVLLDAGTGVINLQMLDGAGRTGAQATAGDISLSSALSISGGTFNFNTVGTVTLPSLAMSGGTLNFNTASPVTLSSLAISGGTLGGTGAVTVSGAFNATGTSTLKGSGTFTTQGTSLIDIVAVNGYVDITNGKTWVNQGTLTVGGDDQITFCGGGFSGANILHNAVGGTLNLSSSHASPLAMSTTATAGSAAVWNDGTTNLTVAGVHNGLAFNNFSSGTINVNAGTLVSGASNNMGVINVATGATFSAAFGGPIGLTNTGTLAGTGTIAVGTGASGLINRGSINPGGTGAAGTLAITGDVLLDTGSILNMELGGTGAGQSDKLVVTGNITTAGTLNASLLGSYTPVNADAIPFLMMGGTASGTFTTTNLPAGFSTGYNLAAGEAARLIYAGGGTITFTNASGGLDWAVPGNWSGGLLPGSLDTALISTGFAVGHASGADAIAALTINSGNSLNVSGGSLAVSGITTLGGGLAVSGTGSATLGGALNGATSGQVSVSGGSLNLGGTASVSALSMSGGVLGTNSALTAGTASFSGGTLSGSGAVTVSGAFNATGTSTLAGTGTFTTQGASLISMAAVNGYVDLSGGRTWINQGTLTVGGDDYISFGLGGGSNTLNNAVGGTLNLSGSEIWPLKHSSGTNTLNNAGILNQLTAGNHFANGLVFNNTGTVNVNDGVFVIVGDGTDTGTYAVSAGAALVFQSGTRNLNAGSNFTGTGTLVMFGTTVNANALTGIATNVQISGGTFNVNTASAVTLPNLLMNGGTLGGTGAVTVSGVFNATGISTLAGTGTFTTQGASLVSMAAANGYVDLSGGKTWINQGTLTVSDDDYISFGLGGGSNILENAVGRTLNLSSSHANPLSQSGGTSTVRNYGTLNQTITGSHDGLAINNFSSGTINVNAGTLVSSASYNYGIINVVTGATFSATSGIGLTNTGTLSGTGTIAVGGGLINQGNINPGGTGAAGTLAIIGDVQLSTGSNLNIELHGTGIDQSDKLAVTGNITTAGALNASLLSGYTPVNADAISFMTYGGTTASGTFTTASLPANFSVVYNNLAANEAARLTYSYTPSAPPTDPCVTNPPLCAAAKALADAAAAKALADAAAAKALADAAAAKAKADADAKAQADAAAKAKADADAKAQADAAAKAKADADAKAQADAAAKAKADADAKAQADADAKAQADADAKAQADAAAKAKADADAKAKTDAATNNDTQKARSEARKAEEEAEKAEELVQQAKTSQEKAVASQYAEVKSSEATVKSAEAKIRTAESELRAAEAEVASVKSLPEKVRAETRKAVAESRHAEGEVDKASAEVKLAEAAAKGAKTPEAKAVAEVKKSEAEAKKAVAEVRKAEVDAKKAETELKQAEAEVKTGSSREAKAVVEVKKAEVESKKAEAEIKKAEAEAKLAKDPATKAAAESKLAEAEAKKANAEAKKADVEAKQADTDAKSSNSPVAKLVAETKKAEAEVKKAEAEVKKAEAEVKGAKDPEKKAKAEVKVAEAETKKAVAEAKQADTEAKKADVEAKQADAEAKKSDSPVVKQVAEAKKAEAEAKKAEAEVKKAEAEVKSAKDPEKKEKAEVKVVEAEAKKADAEAKQADAEVKVAEAKAKSSNKAEDKKEVEDKKADAEVKKAEAEVKKAEAQVKIAKAPSEKEAAEMKRSEAEAQKAEAEFKSAEREAKHDKDQASAPQSGYVRKAVEKKAEATVAKAEARKAEYEAKKLAAEAKRAEVEMKLAEAEAKEAKTPEARVVAEKRFEAKRTEAETKRNEAQTKEQKVASLNAEAASKETEYKDAKRSSDSKIVETFNGMSLASMAKERVQEAMLARHEFKEETLKPALNILKTEPKAADLKPCGPGSGDVCMRPVNPALANLAVDVMPRVQLPLPTPATSFLPTIQRKVAVVIGNNAYQDPNIPSLDGAVKDADAIGKLFKEKMGYDVRMVHNGTRADIVRTLNQIADETGSKDSVVVYYAGHGYQMEDTKVGYWIPSDASTKDPSKWISNSDINKMLTNIPAKQMIMVSDSCYSGALTSEQKITSAIAGKNAQEILGKRSVLVMSSGGEEPVMDEGRDGHSIFAWHLMDRLNNVEQYKNGAEVFEAVKDGVAKDGIPQTPQYGASLSAGHMAGGEYLFEVRKY